MKAASELRVPLFGPMAGPPTLRRPAQPMVFPVRAEHRDEFQALMTWGKSTGLSTMGGHMTANALVFAFKATGRDLSRAGFIKTLESSSFDLGGVRVRYAPGEREGSRFVDLSMVNREARFIH